MLSSVYYYIIKMPFFNQIVLAKQPIKYTLHGSEVYFCKVEINVINILLELKCKWNSMHNAMGKVATIVGKILRR